MMLCDGRGESSAMGSKNPKPVVFIKGDRIVLRPLEMDDLGRCERWINDPDTRVTLAGFMPLNEIAERSKPR